MNSGPQFEEENAQVTNVWSKIEIYYMKFEMLCSVMKHLHLIYLDQNGGVDSITIRHL